MSPPPAAIKGRLTSDQIPPNMIPRSSLSYQETMEVVSSPRFSNDAAAARAAEAYHHRRLNPDAASNYIVVSTAKAR